MNHEVLNRIKEIRIDPMDIFDFIHSPIHQFIRHSVTNLPKDIKIVGTPFIRYETRSICIFIFSKEFPIVKKGDIVPVFDSFEYEIIEIDRKKIEKVRKENEQLRKKTS